MAFVHLGVFLIAVAFAVFAVYLCMVLARISGLLTTVGKTAERMVAKSDETIRQLELTLVEARNSAADVQLKLNALESVTDTIKNAGETAAEAAESVSDLTASYGKQPGLPGTKPFVGLIHAGELASSLFATWKKAEKVTK